MPDCPRQQPLGVRIPEQTQTSQSQLRNITAPVPQASRPAQRTWPRCTITCATSTPTTTYNPCLTTTKPMQPRSYLCQGTARIQYTPSTTTTRPSLTYDRGGTHLTSPSRHLSSGHTPCGLAGLPAYALSTTFERPAHTRAPSAWEPNHHLPPHQRHPLPANTTHQQPRAPSRTPWRPPPAPTPGPAKNRTSNPARSPNQQDPAQRPVAKPAQEATPQKKVLAQHPPPPPTPASRECQLTRRGCLPTSTGPILPAQPSLGLLSHDQQGTPGHPTRHTPAATIPHAHRTTLTTCHTTRCRISRATLDPHPPQSLRIATVPRVRGCALASAAARPSRHALSSRHPPRAKASRRFLYAYFLCVASNELSPCTTPDSKCLSPSGDGIWVPQSNLGRRLVGDLKPQWLSTTGRTRCDGPNTPLPPSHISSTGCIA